MYGIFFNDFDKDCICHILLEAYYVKIYDQFLGKPKKELTILEVGGNIGLVTLYLAPYAKNLYVMEPASQHLEVLNKTVKFNNLDNVTVIPKALAGHDGEAEFFYNDYNYTMFSLKEIGNRSEKVSCMSMTSVLNNIDYVDFMKLDVEGAEIDILASESFRREASRIRSLVVEYHIWGGEKSKLEQVLTDNGYHWWVLGYPIASTLYGGIRHEYIY